MQNIVQPLLDWYAQNARALPWRADQAPYHVLVSEVMLQQTRVETVRAYYLRFTQALPDFAALADCGEERLMKLWEGLGYYRRARSLQAAARVVMTEYGGTFPGKYEQIRALPGVGEYTAGALASICFGLCEPAVDGNVLRVMARLTNDASDIGGAGVRRRFREALRAVYPADRPGDFTQALMELGACVCTPRTPRCAACPLGAHCAGLACGMQSALPVRGEKRPRRQETRTVFLLRCEADTALRRRAARGLLAGLWELPSVEGALGAQAALDQAQAWGVLPLALEKTLQYTHVFTHVQWHMTCHVLRCGRRAEGFIWAAPEDMEGRYTLPSAFKPFL